MGFIEIVTKFFLVFFLDQTIYTPFPDFTCVMLAWLVFLSD